MSEIDDKCLDTFPQWLKGLPTDATDLAEAVEDGEAPEAVRRYAAAGLNYLFKSLDLIPDGIEDLGFLDDAFVIRVAAKLAVEEASDAEAKAPRVARLGAGAALIEELLGDDDYPRLVSYVKNLKNGAARGRTVDDILGDEAVRREFTNEVRGWATSYEAPSFGRDEKNLVKLKSFMSAKLP
ncbi:MAG: YkvA family protein [Myxococcota bacterium]